MLALCVVANKLSILKNVAAQVRQKNAPLKLGEAEWERLPPTPATTYALKTLQIF